MKQAILAKSMLPMFMTPYVAISLHWHSENFFLFKITNVRSIMNRKYKEYVYGS